jgi:hypothetical protein
LELASKLTEPVSSSSLTEMMFCRREDVVKGVVLVTRGDHTYLVKTRWIECLSWFVHGKELYVDAKFHEILTSNGAEQNHHVSVCL